jgi:2-amino-4-hydroxy-6-hydroxymethyldihydropteridine diphosphokinase
MNNAFLLIGGNIGDRLKSLGLATNALEKIGKVISESCVYETAAWGVTDQPSFLNKVLHIETELYAIELLKKLLEIEESIGRKRLVKFGPRKIDIDILFFNDDVVESEQLIIPHPQIQHRKFVLVPMNELQPTLKHPVLKKSINQLMLECPDQLDVKVFSC